jgi:hypothetical protein
MKQKIINHLDLVYVVAVQVAVWGMVGLELTQ